MKAEYFDNGGDAIARLHWRVPSMEEYDMLNMYGDASKVIRESDVVIAVMGINQSIEREGQDRSSIELPKISRSLFAKHIKPIRIQSLY